MTDLIPKEFKVIALRDCPVPESMQICDTPDTAADYWRMHIATHPYFDSERECLAIILLNARRRVKGHQLVTIGTMDTVLVHPREVFRVAVVGCAAAIVLMHNHPSGDPAPSEADNPVPMRRFGGRKRLIPAYLWSKTPVFRAIILGSRA